MIRGSIIIYIPDHEGKTGQSCYLISSDKPSKHHDLIQTYQVAARHEYRIIHAHALPRNSSGTAAG